MVGSNQVLLVLAAGGCWSVQVYLMMRTLRDMNMSKFVAEDVPLFLSLIDDLFPGTACGWCQLPTCQVALCFFAAQMPASSPILP
jgi:Na+-translocating ferredoxin:NAD+ oxidoreductase RNF subunit RnfB